MRMKKFLFLVCAVFCLALLIQNAAAAEASAETRAAHTHPLCGSRCSCTSSSHTSATWNAWDGTTKLYNGNYYLTQDVVLSSTMILDYSYTTNLCLNGHSITCADTVFDIYSYRSLLITDCVGTGKVESTDAMCTIGNNKYLSIWGGTILNSNPEFSAAINAYPNTNTYLCGGRIESVCDGIYSYQGSKVQIQGGEIYITGKSGYAIGGQDDDSGVLGSVTISGGRITSAPNVSGMLDIQNGNFTMTGGYVDCDVYIYDSEGTTTIRGGTVTGGLDCSSKEISITGGSVGGYYIYFYGNTEISAGTFGGNVSFLGPNSTVTGGNFSGCNAVKINKQTWICGGNYKLIQVENVPLYLSGVPQIEVLQVGYPGKVSAQSLDGSGSFGGSTVQVRLDHPYSSTVWKDGDIVIKNVKSDAVASKFVLAVEDSRWMYLERSGNDLVLRVLPHGTWGSNATWGLVDGTLTVSCTGALMETTSGSKYPWGAYSDQITKIIVEPGITDIPRYAFEYCENVKTISLPDTVKSVSLHAFQDCGSLNDLLLPSSVTSITGTSNTLNPSFIRCESLTDLYYLGTQEEWIALTSNRITSSDSKMTVHFLQLREVLPTCTQKGTAPYYQFDDISVYSGMYDENKKPISVLETVPPLGHTQEILQAVTSGCTTTGQTEGIRCSVCKEVLLEQKTLDPLGHSFKDYISDANATCTENGTKTAKCDRCDVTDTQLDAGSALGHNYEDRICTNCQEPVSRISGASLTLSSPLRLNIALELNGCAAEDYTLRATLGQDTQYQTFAYGSGAQLPAHRLYEPVKLELVYNDRVIHTETWTMEGYAAYLRSSFPQNTRMMTLLDALEAYGTWAAYYADPTGTAPSTPADTVTQGDLLAYRKSVTACITEDLKPSLGLCLDDSCHLWIKFDAAGWGERKLFVDGKEVTPTLAEGKMVWQIAGLRPQDWGSFYHIQVQEADGRVIFESKCCVLSYAYTVLGMAQELQPGLTGLLKAMYLYSQAAVDYQA